MTLFATYFRRLGQSWRWLLVQLLLTPVLLLLGVAWTRIPDKTFLEVAATFLLPLLLVVSFLELEAGTLRSFATDDGRRVKLVWGAVGVLLIVLGLWIGWRLTDTLDGHVSTWASYLNSQSPAHTSIFTYARYERALNVMVWIVRWIVIPGLLLPIMLPLAQWGKSIPWRRVFRLFIDWKWWLGITVAALLGVLLPSCFFDSLPKGTVSAQEWHLGLKLGGAFLLKLVSWVLALGWLAVLFDRIPETARSREAELFCRNLQAGRRWIAASLGIILLINLPVWPLTAADEATITARLAMGIRIAAIVAILLLVIFLYRSMFPEPAKKTKLYWGMLASIAWFGVTFGVASLDEKFPLPLVHWQWGDFVTFVFFAPFVASAAVWGWLLPWKRILRLFLNPRWLAVGVATFFAQTYLTSPIGDQFAGSAQPSGGISHIHDLVAMSLDFGIVVLQLAWLAALLAPVAPQQPVEEQPVGVSVGPDDPERSSSIQLDPPE
jgi:hypothetical protein